MTNEVDMNIQCQLLVGPHEGELLTEDRFEPLVEMPAFINAKKIKYCYLVIIVGTYSYMCYYD